MSAANPQASPAASSVPAPSSVALGSDLAASAAAAAAASSSSSSSPPPPTAANVAAQGAPGPSTPLVQSQAGPALSQGNMVITPMPPPAVPQNVKLESGHVVDKVDKPFVYGSAAFWQGKNISETQHSHKWTVYLRGLENEDLSYFIKSVAFTLHQSFTEPTRGQRGRTGNGRGGAQIALHSHSPSDSRRFFALSLAQFSTPLRTR
jgi:hypothetical protein